MEFVAKLHWNVRSAAGELLPVSALKNDLRLALAAASRRSLSLQRDQQHSKLNHSLNQVAGSLLANEKVRKASSMFQCEGGDYLQSLTSNLFLMDRLHHRVRALCA